MNQLQSEQIDQLVAALTKAQGEINNAIIDDKNPHFGSEFASYEAFRKATLKPLISNGLSITHLLDVSDGKRVMVTQLSHVSGQWMRSYLLIPQEKETPQGIGSAITYSKRYSLGAFLAIGIEKDDDGEAAEAPYRYITDIQKREIQTVATPKQIEYFLKIAQVSSLEKLPSSEFEKIMQALKQERAS